MRTLLSALFFAVFGTYALGELGWVDKTATDESTTRPEAAHTPQAVTKPLRFTDRIASRQTE